MKNDISLTSSQAAERLHATFGPSTRYWLMRIQNERKPGRAVPFPLPCMKDGGRFAYPESALDAWISAELARRVAKGQAPISRVGEVLLAFGAEGGGPATGRRLNFHLSSQLDEDSGEHFAQFTVTSPLLVFRLSRDQVHTMAGQFSAMAEELARDARQLSLPAATRGQS